jgi:hypothetical protein
MTTKSCAFVATSFGFGPVSKAASIAVELRNQVPQMERHFFGAGISFDYARKSGAFDLLTNIDVDNPEQLVRLLPTLTSYSAVFSVLNLGILPLWNSTYPPLHFVDSLAWMWPSPPEGIENVATYFVQDYLLSSQRIQEWASVCPVVLIPPIEPEITSDSKIPVEKRNLLAVNFSGCANPFAPVRLYEDYASVLTAAILKEAGERFNQIIFCCNERLAEYLRRNFAAHTVSFGHFSHADFLQTLVSAEMVLSAPGITSTLEALALDVPIRFLLPQNDSQALISERCKSLLGEECCMAFSRFGPQFTFPMYLPPKESVALALDQLRTILANHRSEVSSMVSGLMSQTAGYSIAALRSNITKHWNCSGQEMVVSKFVASTERSGVR